MPSLKLLNVHAVLIVVSKRSVVVNRVVSDKSDNVEHVLCARCKSDMPSSMSVVTERKSCGKSHVTRVSDDSDSADRKSVSHRASRVPEGKANVSKSSRESRHRH